MRNNRERPVDGFALVSAMQFVWTKAMRLFSAAECGLRGRAILSPYVCATIPAEAASYEQNRGSPRGRTSTDVLDSSVRYPDWIILGGNEVHAGPPANQTLWCFQPKTLACLLLP